MEPHLIFFTVNSILRLADRLVKRGVDMRITIIMTWVLLVLIPGGLAWAQEEIDQLELETETSFFEAQNAQRQLEQSKDQLLKEQLETRAAQEKSEAIVKKSKETRERVETERVKIEKQRSALLKERTKYNDLTEKKSKEIRKIEAQYELEKSTLDKLAKEVRELKAQNRSYDEKIEKYKRAIAESKRQNAKGQRIKANQERNLAKRKKIFDSLGNKSASSVGNRLPASSGPPVKVKLKPDSR